MANKKNTTVGILSIIAVSIFAFNSCANMTTNNTPTPTLTPNVTTLTPTPTTPPTLTPETLNSNPAYTILEQLTISEPQQVAYDRDEWRHWNNIKPCWSVREQKLAAQAFTDGTLTLLDSNKNRTYTSETACYVAGGTWLDPYTGEYYSNPEDLDIDHIIPLSYAAKHGGQAWDENKKQDYANSLKHPNHLIAVSASANRSKSDKGPSEWKPANTAYWCTYATNWVEISQQWNLSITQSDKLALKDMLDTCQ